MEINLVNSDQEEEKCIGNTELDKLNDKEKYEVEEISTLNKELIIQKLKEE